MPPVADTVIQTITYQLVYFQVDMTSGTGLSRFTKAINGVAKEIFEVAVPATDLPSLLAAAPAAGKSRGDDITDAIYQYALDHGYMTGKIQ